MTREQLNLLKIKLKGKLPEHLKPVTLTVENYRSYELYKLVHDQINVDFGHIVGLNLGAITTVFLGLGINREELYQELIKMKIFHNYIVKKKE